MHTGEKPAPTVNYLSAAFNSTSTPSTGLYLTVSAFRPLFPTQNSGPEALSAFLIPQNLECEDHRI